MVPVTFFYLISFFKLFWFLFSFPGTALKEPSESGPDTSKNHSAQVGLEVQEEDPWGADPSAGVRRTSTSHTLLKPRGVNSALAGEHKAKKAPAANPTSGEKNILAGASSVHGCAGGSPVWPHSWWGKLTHSMWVLPRNLKDAQCLCILLENMQKKHSSNRMFLYLTPKESCRILKKQVHSCELSFSLMWVISQKAVGHHARGREQGQRNEWEERQL